MAIYLDVNAPLKARVNDLLNRMTLEEKVAQLGSIGPKNLLDDHGKFDPEKAKKSIPLGMGQITRIAGGSSIDPQAAALANNDIQDFIKNNTRLGIPTLFHEECLSGLMIKGGTTYPQAIGLAASWNLALVERMTEEIKIQMLAIGARLGLSPVLDLARDLRWGRVEETFGEDPYLVAAMAVAYTKGLHGDDLKQGVVSTLKHFAGHGFSDGGRNHAPVNISPREFYESCLFPYEATIKETNPLSVMNAYHDIDGIPCASSKHLLTDILRGELGFEGIVVADYNSVKMLHTEHKVAATPLEAGVMALEAGLDIELPRTEYYGQNLIDAVNSGVLSMATIDLAVSRHLEVKFKLGLFENPYVNTEEVISVFETPAQRQLSREIAQETIVLLKNENALLPLNPQQYKSIAVIGPSADSTRNVLGDYVYSAHVDKEDDAVEIVSVLDGIKAKVGANVQLNYAMGCGIMNHDSSGIPAAVEAAKNSEIAIVVVGGRSGLSGLVNPADISDVVFTSRGYIKDTDGESHDRTDLTLTGMQQELLEAVHATGTPMIVVLVNGRPLTVEWMAENVPAILEAWLPGEEAGNAIADVIFGDYNPSGKLPVSIPKHVGQLPIHYNRNNISFNRHYIDIDSRARYSFGHGLSYTEFQYDNLKITPTSSSPCGKITVELDVTNIGDYAGAEVVQLYVRDQYASRARPVKELKGFAKIELEQNQTRQVKFILDTDLLAFYDKDMNLVVEPGIFDIMVGSSSEDIRLHGELEITGTVKEIGPARTYFTKVEL